VVAQSRDRPTGALRRDVLAAHNDVKGINLAGEMKLMRSMEWRPIVVAVLGAATMASPASARSADARSGLEPKVGAVVEPCSAEASLVPQAGGTWQIGVLHSSFRHAR